MIKLPSKLRSILPRYSYVYLDAAFTTVPKRRSLLDYLHDGARPPVNNLDILVDFLPRSNRRALAPEVAKLRRIKSKAEVELMRKAADISAIAHAKVRGQPPAQPPAARGTWWAESLTAL